MYYFLTNLNCRVPVDAGTKETDIRYNQCVRRNRFNREDAQEQDSVEVSMSFYCQNLGFLPFDTSCVSDGILNFLVCLRGLDVSKPGETIENIANLQVQNMPIYSFTFQLHVSLQTLLCNAQYYHQFYYYFYVKGIC